MILWAVDGSTIPLPQTNALRKVFGSAGSRFTKEPANVTARIDLFYDVLNGLNVKGSLHPYFSSEMRACADSLEELDFQNKVLLPDRGYASFWLLYLLMKKRITFVLRVRQSENIIVKRFVASPQEECTAQWYPGYCSRKRLGQMGWDIAPEANLKIRMVKVILPTGAQEVLVTNLYDSRSYICQDMKFVYGLRWWGIETGYGHLKEKLQLAQFSGIHQVCIEQDFAAGLLLLNLQSLIEKQSEPYLEAVNRRRKHRYHVNKNVSLGILKYRVVRLFLETSPLGILMELESLFEKQLEPVRPGRRYARLKIRPPNGKFYTLTNYKRAF